METQQLLLYLALGFVCLLIYEAWITDYYTSPRAPAKRTVPSGTSLSADLSGPPDVPTLRRGDDGPPAPLSAATTPAAAASTRVRVTTDVLDVTLDTVGGTVATVDLLDHAVSIDRPDEPFALVSDDPARHLVAQSGLRSTPGTPAPTHREPMRAGGDAFALADADDALRVPLAWRSPDGVTVVKTFAFERGGHEIGVEYRIVNGSATPWTVNQYRQLVRSPATTEERGRLVRTYVGGVVSTSDDVYEKVDFGDMADTDLDVDATNGWVAMIQHWFATAWIPVPGEANAAYTRHLPTEDRYLIGLVSAPVTVPPGETATLSTTLYAGPKVRDELAAAAPNLELTVDYGPLTFIARPLFRVLQAVHSAIGNWGFSIVVVTFMIKAAFHPLSAAGYRSMARMKALQPKLAALKERHGEDRAEMGRATMELYRAERANPLGGCLPMLLQVPVFIALYWTLVESVELRHAPWILWIQDLSIRDPWFVLPVAMAVTMHFQQKLGTPPADPLQAKVMRCLPFAFGAFFAFFPAGLLLYWVTNNALSIAQQRYVTRRVRRTAEAGG